MKLSNFTDIPDELIRKIVRFVKPQDVSNFDLMVKNHPLGTYAGAAYTNGSSYHATASPFVVVRIGPKKRFPQPPAPPRGPGYLPDPWVASREEGLVKILAHELRHMWQAKHPKGWRVWGARGKYSERDADAYALRKLREWRKTNEIN